MIFPLAVFSAIWYNLLEGKTNERYRNTLVEKLSQNLPKNL